MTREPADLLGGDRLLTTGEVADLFRVDPKTVGQWAKPHPKTGRVRLPSTLTPGGQRRYRASDVAELLDRERRRP